MAFSKAAIAALREALVAGWAALGRDFDPASNPGGPKRWWSYSLVCLERAGAFTGVTHLGETDWYCAGAEVLLKARRGTRWYLEYSPEVDTSFAILFLLRSSKTRDVMAKLEKQLY